MCDALTCQCDCFLLISDKASIKLTSLDLPSNKALQATMAGGTIYPNSRWSDPVNFIICKYPIEPRLTFIVHAAVVMVRS